VNASHESQGNARAPQGLHESVAKLLDKLNPSPEARILDLGCGTGAFLERLHKMGRSNLTGIDIDPPAGYETITYLQADLSGDIVGRLDGRFDVVVAIEVIEHVDNLGLFLQSIATLLSSRGVCLITTPNLHSVEARIRLLFTGRLTHFDCRSDPTHISPIFLHPFATLARWHGLVVVNVSHHPYRAASMNSSLPLRLLASCVRMLGVQGMPDGDTLIMTVQRAQIVNDESSSQSQFNLKKGRLTAHYSA